MALICRIFGHAPFKHRKMTITVMDSFGTQHVTLYATCSRCGAEYQDGLIPVRSTPMALTVVQSKAFAEGDFVVCLDGSVGMLEVMRIYPYMCTVKFGADGPYAAVPWRSLRRATGKDIVEAGLLGVGCTPDQEEAAANYDNHHRWKCRQRWSTWCR